MTRVATWVLMAAVTAAVGCGDDTTAGTGGGGTGGGGTGGGGTGGGTGGDTTTTTGSDTTTSSTGSPTTTTGAGGEGGAGGQGGAGGGGQAVCGNGVVEDGEACDDDGESATCDVDCTPAACGDAVLNVTAGEACDDAGESAECDVDCSAATCGDSTLNESAGETCDTGGRSASCDADCTSTSCGDGVVNAAAGEACDDGGESAACDVDCSAVDCGDGVTNEAAGEACDDGNDVDTDTCLGSCVAATCGDGVVQAGVEQCDDGDDDAGDGCGATCQFENAACAGAYTLWDRGDRNVTFNDGNDNVEWCDSPGDLLAPDWAGPGWYRFTGEAGKLMPEVPPEEHACGTDAPGWLDGTHPAVADGEVQRDVCFSYFGNTCQWQSTIGVVNCGEFYLYEMTDPGVCALRYCGTTCGDGVVDAGEACDDGNDVETDACLRSCEAATCGDGVVQAGVEQCDDGGVTPGDGCSATCQSELHPQCAQPVFTFDRADRNNGFNDGDTGNEFCDSASFTSPDWQGAGWYRFAGGAGSRMPESVPALFSCQTDAPGWLNGTHPAILDGVVNRQVCFNWAGNSCNWNANVQVVHCGDHYRYNLPLTPACHLRYCGSN